MAERILGDLVGRLRIDTSDLRRVDRDVQGATGRMGGHFKSFAAAAVKAGALAGGALAGFSIKSAIDFESAFAGVRKTVDASESEFAALAKGIRQMSTELPASTTEIAKVAEAAGQLGVKKENILAFSRTMVDLGETTNLSADMAATGMARFANVTALPQEQIQNLGSALVALGNAGASTEAEILEMGQRLAAAGTIAGISQPEILGFANALSSAGIEAEAGGTAFSKVFTELANATAKGGAELQGFAKIAGSSTDAFAKKFKTDAAGATIDFVEGLGRINAEGGNVFQTLDDLGIVEIRMRNALLSAAGAGDLMRESVALGTKAFKENTALTDEAQKRYETFASQLTVARNKLADVALTVGTVLAPRLQDLLKGIGSLGPVFRAVFGFISDNIGPLSAGFGAAAAVILALLVPAFIAWATAAGAAAIATIAAAAPIIALVAGIGLLVGGLVYAYQNFETFRNIVQGVMDFLSTVVTTVLAVITGVWRKFGDDILAFVTGAFTSIKSVFQGGLQIIKGIFDVFAGIFTGDWSRVWDGIKGIVSGAINAIKGALSGLPGMLRGLVGGLLDAGNALGGAILDGIVAGLKGAAGFVADVGRALFNALATLVNDRIIDSINKAMEFRIEVLGKGVDINPPNLPRIPRLHSGGVVPGLPGQEVLALLKAGERVQTRDQARLSGAATINIYPQQANLDEFALMRVLQRIERAS